MIVFNQPGVILDREGRRLEDEEARKVNPNSPLIVSLNCIIPPFRVITHFDRQRENILHIAAKNNSVAACKYGVGK